MEIPPKGRYTRSTGTGRGLYGGVGLGDSVVALYTPCTGIHTQPPGLPAGTTPIHTLGKGREVNTDRTPVREVDPEYR